MSARKPCPTPHKSAFATRSEVIHSALRMARWYPTGGRPYRCQCGYWHLSTRPTRETA